MSSTLLTDTGVEEVTPGVDYHAPVSYTHLDVYKRQSYYWHFVDAIWVVLFGVLYLLR